jgi:hypothetical protein
MKSPASHFARTAGLAAAILAGGIAATSAQPTQTFRAVRVDVSGLPAGAGFAREQFSQCLVRALTQNLAPRINARATQVLVVRPTAVYLAPQTSDGGRRFGGTGGASDWVSGEAIIGRTRIPLDVSVAADGFGSMSMPLTNAYRRTESLCNSFAYWLAQKL